MLYPLIQFCKENMYILSNFLHFFASAILLSACRNPLTSQIILKSTTLARHAGFIRPHRTWPVFSTYAPDCGGFALKGEIWMLIYLFQHPYSRLSMHAKRFTDYSQHFRR